MLGGHGVFHVHRLHLVVISNISVSLSTVRAAVALRSLEFSSVPQLASCPRQKQLGFLASLQMTQEGNCHFQASSLSFVGLSDGSSEI